MLVCWPSSNHLATMNHTALLVAGLLGSSVFVAQTSPFQAPGPHRLGYADITLSSMVWKMIANPLEAVDNRVSVLFPSPPEGTSLDLFDETSQGWAINTYEHGHRQSDPRGRFGVANGKRRV